MPRGGRRTGTPGMSYANRSDLQVPAMAATGQQYGARAEQMVAQRALPVARPATDAVPTAPPAAPASSAAPAGPMPGGLGFADETARPGEPVTAGVPVGPGPGPEALGGPPGLDSPLRLQLGAIYQMFPTEEIRQLIELEDGKP